VEQKNTKEQRKTVRFTGERTMSPFEAWGNARWNKDKLRKYGYVFEDKEQTLSNGIKIYKGGVFDWDESRTSLPKEQAKAVHHYTHLYETYHFNNNNNNLTL
jgi:hypothetical protein